ncbi:MAG: MFS transporter [Proteobacteria bacterium]|nr:MFS transporter [Pseudomonadota bacterium]
MNYRETARIGSLAGILAPITVVKNGEARRALLIAFNFFLLFTAYYMIKPIRESLILSLNSGAEIKSVASGIQAVAFMALVPAYSALAGRFSGRGILIFVYLFLASNLLIFTALLWIGFPYLGIIFFLWVGIFNLLIISQMWSLCNDIYTPEQGKRLFPLIAVGATSGAVFGSLILSHIIHNRGLYWPMIIATGLLVVCSAIVHLATRDTSPAAARLPTAEGSPWKRLSGGFGLVFSNRYLTLVALFVLLTNFVNTNSEYMLGKLVSEYADEQVRSGLAAGVTQEEIIRAFYARFFFWVNISVLVLQLFIVSRVIRHFGVRFALLALPFLALINYSLIIFLPLLPVIFLVKILENSTDYSLNHTAREILFLPVLREEKYKAKFAVDTCFWRGGDALSGLLAVPIIVVALGLGITAIAGLNTIAIILWIVIIQRVSARRRALLNRDN